MMWQRASAIYCSFSNYLMRMRNYACWRANITGTHKRTRYASQRARDATLLNRFRDVRRKKDTHWMQLCSQRRNMVDVTEIGCKMLL